jgi:hypothetical protein
MGCAACNALGVASCWICKNVLESKECVRGFTCELHLEYFDGLVLFLRWRVVTSMSVIVFELFSFASQNHQVIEVFKYEHNLCLISTSEVSGSGYKTL